MTKLEVRTASPANSIWRDLPEDTFRQHLVELEERTNAVPIDPRIYGLKQWKPNAQQQPDYTLALETEQRLADDFASLVAVQEGAQSVAAVCVEELLHDGDSRGLGLRFAAADLHVDEAVHEALTMVAAVLRNVAVDSISQHEAAAEHVEAVFHIVTQLHHHRILARLRSTKWQKPKHLSKSHKKPLWQDFANLIHRAQFCYTRKEKDQRIELEALLQELAEVYEAFEAVERTSSGEVSALKDLILASFTFANNARVQDFIQRVEAIAGNPPTKQVSSAIKCIRQIEKIAAYRRICVSLTTIAHEHATLFENVIQIEYLPPYQSTPTNISYEIWAKTCHVHAEVQLCVYHDLMAQNDHTTSSLPPRTIGISKWLCYLCYLFLKAHGLYFSSRTHGRLYDQWTIPDLAEYSEDTLRRYRNVIDIMDREVLERTRNEPELWRIEPMTSMEYRFPRDEESVKDAETAGRDEEV